MFCGIILCSLFSTSSYADVETSVVITSDLELVDSLLYRKGIRTPYTGKIEGRVKGEVNEGLLTGPFTRLCDNGRFFSFGQYKKGKKEGSWKYYDGVAPDLWTGKNCHVSHEFNNSSICNGRVIASGDYENDRRVGEWRLSDYGRIQTHFVKYKSGVEVKRKTRDSVGSSSERNHQEDSGPTVDSTEVSLRNSLIHQKDSDTPFTGRIIGSVETQVEDGKLQGRYLEYCDDGVLFLEGRQYYGRRVDRWVIYGGERVVTSFENSGYPEDKKFFLMGRPKNCNGQVVETVFYNMWGERHDWRMCSP